MAVQPGVWGIDIGQCAVKAIRLQLIEGKVTATAFDYVEHPKILSQPDADPDQLTREALEKFLSRNPIKGDKVAISVPGQSGLARFVKLPPVEEKKIDDIVKFEAKQQIPFPLEEVVWDYQKVSEGTVEGGFAIDTEIGLFAMKRDMINRFMNHFQGVNVEVHCIQMSPLALCNYITYDMLNRGGPDAPAPEAAGVIGKKKCIVALDIGTDGSNLIITDGGKIIWQRPIPIGGNHFTRALTKELKLTFAKAEHLKRNAARSPELANILKALKPVLTDFVGEVQRSLGYFTNTHRDAQVEYLVGLGSAFKLPGLQKYLGDKLQLRVEKPAKFNRVVGEAVTNAPVFIENILTFPVAYGLALQGLGVSRLATTLLPPEITWDRKIRAKKPWAVAAAALLMIGTGVLAFGYSVPFTAVNDPKIGEALKKGEEAKKQATTVEQQINTEKGSVETGLNAVQAIIAGADERKNWMYINEYINESLPVPGPNGNMNTPDLVPLWNSVDGMGGGSKRATEKYYERIRKGVDPKLAFLDDDLRQYLAAVDIEAVYFRYTPTLDSFFKKAKEYCYKWVGSGEAIFYDMDPAERSPMMGESPVYPTGPGWVVEIRGTTWYEQGTVKGKEFLSRTLLANLKANAKNFPANEVRGKVSHIFLYNTWKDENPRPDDFQWIDTSLIDSLIPQAETGGNSGYMSGNMGYSPIPGGAGGGTGGATGNETTSQWVPLSRGTAGKSAAGATGGSGGNSYERSSVAPSTAEVSGKDGSKTSAKQKPRYEFVVLFVWKEPTPSDRFIKKAPSTTQPASPGTQTGKPMGPGRGTP